MKSEMSPDCCLLVVSCDRYADVWDPFFSLFHRYWTDCPYKVFLSSNMQQYSDPAVITVMTGIDLDWSRSLLTAISSPKIQRYPYLLVILEDLMLYQHVDTITVQNCLNFLKEGNGNYLRLVPIPPPDKPLLVPTWLGEISEGAPYRASLQASIWRREYLRSLLKPGESPWDFEVLASRRSDIHKGFYCTRKRVLHYHNSIERGLWLPQVVEFLNKEGIIWDKNRRGVLSEHRLKQRKTWGRYLAPWRSLPLSWRMHLRSRFHKVSKLILFRYKFRNNSTSKKE